MGCLVCGRGEGPALHTRAGAAADHTHFLGYTVSRFLFLRSPKSSFHVAIFSCLELCGSPWQGDHGECGSPMLRTA